jgi:hypothetical protein
MLTEKDYCDFDTCVALKELGMKGYAHPFVNVPKIPLYSAQKWLREEIGILLQPTYLELSDEWICVLRDKNKRHGYSAQKQKNYEEALSEGIKTAVKLLKEE